MADIITHSVEQEISETAYYQKLKDRIEASTDLALSKEETLKIFEQMQEFEMGRFLLKNGGFDGYWIAYLILHAPKKTNLHPLEHFIVHDAPVVQATRHRFYIFQDELQNRIYPGIKMASVPCGLMDDLLSLKYRGMDDFSITGIDLDKNSLKLASKNAKERGIKNVEFLERDAWNLGIHEEYDILVSNGLNIYEPDPDRLVALYRNFYEAIVPGGVLITSFLSTTHICKDVEAMKKQKAVFADVRLAMWHDFTTEEKVRGQLESVGFKIVDVRYEQHNMFPTIIGEKPFSDSEGFDL